MEPHDQQGAAQPQAKTPEELRRTLSELEKATTEIRSTLQNEGEGEGAAKTGDDEEGRGEGEESQEGEGSFRHR